MSDWGWAASLIFCIGIALMLAGVVCLLAWAIRWHRENFRFIPKSRLNAHRVTPAIPFAQRDQKERAR